VKIQTIAPVEGRSWPVGHTILVDAKLGHELIDAGVAIHHPTVTDPPPSRPCPCEDKNEPCEECDKKKAAKKRSTRKRPTNSNK